MRKYGKIAVLAGGSSSEREISLKSGRAVYEALRRKGQDVDVIDVGEEFLKDPEGINESDIAFIALHGKFGEDGSLQALLDERRISYTGSGVRASQLAMDKIASREIFLKIGLKTPEYIVVTKETKVENISHEFETPFVVKPSKEGSSIGLSIVSDKAHGSSAIEAAFIYGTTVIIEEYIHGREITVGILDEKALPVVEIITRHNIYDFHAKYIDDGTKYVVPADIEGEVSARAQGIALEAHKALGCRDFSRVDMRMDYDGNIYVLEVNTIPGLTRRSLLPKAAEAAGLGFDDLCIKLIDLADRRKKDGKEKYEKS